MAEEDDVIENEGSEAADFAAFFAEADDGQADDGAGESAPEDGQGQESPEDGEHTASASQATPAAQTATEQAESSGSQAPDYQALYEAAQHRAASAEGRVRKYEEMLRSGQTRAEGDGGKAQGQDDPFTRTLAYVPPEERQVIEDNLGGGDDPYARANLNLARAAARAEIAQEVEPVLAEMQKERAAAHHTRVLSERHPDWREVAQSQQFHDWMNGQPPILREPLLAVARSGTAEQVSELLGAYKQHAAAGSQPRPNAQAKDQGAVRTRSGTPRVNLPRPSAPGSSAEQREYLDAWDEAGKPRR